MLQANLSMPKLKHLGVQLRGVSDMKLFSIQKYPKFMLDRTIPQDSGLISIA